ncbi:MAG TPA: lysophospholipid acyltransferase family protein [Aromatoleum sp.]|uniref:lysophospholipid acyltransferase family protein n=1 Tax=Aromatoleum sp. TaxID=2307007 RepID=UPI002B483D4B|nr:lysophospholipid acyltransferase family protein [Aromatoleum sp.]HJV28458.1 lysophospholipid acyltransferase family protein [Aromatoleum sp.]
MRVARRPARRPALVIVTVDFLFRILARFPLSWLHCLGGIAGWLTWRFSPTYARRLEENLTRALGRRDPAVLRAAIREAGRQALELPYVWLRPQDEVLSRIVRVEGAELLAQARADGASVLLLTPHLGCFEMCAQYCSTHGPITVLFREPRKAALGPLMEAGRKRGNISVAPADVSGVRRLVKALRGGEMVGMLPDQAPGQGEGVWAPFFGKLAWTMTLAARLSEVKGVRVIMLWTERLPRGQGYVLRVSEPVEPITGSLEERCVKINRAIERLILACPQQYLWGYNRYKRPSGVEPPPAEGGAQ